MSDLVLNTQSWLDGKRNKVAQAILLLLTFAIVFGAAAHFNMFGANAQLNPSFFAPYLVGAALVLIPLFSAGHTWKATFGTGLVALALGVAWVYGPADQQAYRAIVGVGVVFGIWFALLKNDEQTANMVSGTLVVGALAITGGLLYAVVNSVVTKYVTLLSVDEQKAMIWFVTVALVFLAYKGLFWFFSPVVGYCHSEIQKMTVKTLN